MGSRASACLVNRCRTERRSTNRTEFHTVAWRSASAFSSRDPAISQALKAAACSVFVGCVQVRGCPPPPPSPEMVTCERSRVLCCLRRCQHNMQHMQFTRMREKLAPPPPLPHPAKRQRSGRQPTQTLRALRAHYLKNDGIGAQDRALGMFCNSRPFVALQTPHQ